MDQTLHRVATKEERDQKNDQAEDGKTTREGGNHLEQESNRQRTMEDIVGGLHPRVDGQSIGGKCVKSRF